MLRCVISQRGDPSRYPGSVQVERILSVPAVFIHNRKKVSTILKWNSHFPVSVSAVHRTGGEIHVQVEILIVHTYIDTTIDNGGPSCTVTDWPFIISVNFTITIDIFIDQIPGKDGCITFPVNIYRIIINLLL